MDLKRIASERRADAVTMIARAGTPAIPEAP